MWDPLQVGGAASEGDEMHLDGFMEGIALSTATAAEDLPLHPPAVPQLPDGWVY